MKNLQQQVLSQLPGAAEHIVVGVSGGVDSVVLLHLLKELQPVHAVQLSVVHVDHGIRRESGQDAAFVAELCQRWSIPCHIVKRDVPALATTQHLSLETAGRNVRRAVLEGFASDHGAQLIALAHHRDDQAETFLFRLLRGSGSSGLCAMQALRGKWWRPLLECSREQIVAYAREYELAWVEDCSNLDLSYSRNRIRHRLIPLLAELNPRYGDSLNGLVGQLQEEEDYWQQQTEAGYCQAAEPGDDGLKLARKVLCAMHPALQKRVLRRALQQVRGSLHGIDRQHLYALAALLNGTQSQAQLDLPGCWAARRYEILWLRPLAPKPYPVYNHTITVPGEQVLPDGRILRAFYCPTAVAESRTRVFFAADLLEFPLRVRSWCHGDRFQPFGMTGSKKLKRFFADQRMTAEERGRVPIVCDQERILWIAGERRSRHALISEEVTKIVCLELAES